MQSKGKTSEARQKTDTADLLLFQRRLKDKIQLFEKEKEMESTVMIKVNLFIDVIFKCSKLLKCNKGRVYSFYITSNPKCIH